MGITREGAWEKEIYFEAFMGIGLNLLTSISFVYFKEKNLAINATLSMLACVFGLLVEQALYACYAQRERLHRGLAPLFSAELIKRRPILPGMVAYYGCPMVMLLISSLHSQLQSSTGLFEITFCGMVSLSVFCRIFGVKLRHNAL